MDCFSHASNSKFYNKKTCPNTQDQEPANRPGYSCFYLPEISKHGDGCFYLSNYMVFVLFFFCFLPLPG